MNRLSWVGDWLWQAFAKAKRLIASVGGSIRSRVRRMPAPSNSNTDFSPASGHSFIVPDAPLDQGASEAHFISDASEKAPLPPGQRIYAIGDIHGRADLLNSLIAQIEADCAEYDGESSIVFLGDYIDRGFQSRQVIDVILSGRLSAFDVYCLKGNHEEAMLNFLANPDFGPRWAAYGGRETIVSYGVRPPRNHTRPDDWQDVHAAFVEALPIEHESFLMRLLPSVRIGGYGFAHAGLKPGIPFDEQSERDLLWIREEFLNHRDPLDVIVVHGHTPVEHPFWDSRRINVDTGAYISGRLTAVRLEGNTVAFLSTRI